jgi:lipopolysaccharide/colanic/teichoic acid biosynthesis glycosyltransferase
MLRKWDNLPNELKNEEVREYYELLRKKRVGLFFKRLFDISVSLVLLLIFSPLFLIIAFAIKLDSKGPVFFRQVRVTRYGKKFRIFKFRSMRVDHGDKTLITTSNDARITKVGHFIRKFKLDEISQLIDVLRGKMSFVGTRQEVPKFVEQYTPEMMATLLMPAGITSLASIYYKNESELISEGQDTDSVYIDDILPAKMHYNLKSLKEFSFFGDLKVMFMTIFAVLGKEYKGDRKVKTKEKEFTKV